jgi:hypothetical protein
MTRQETDVNVKNIRQQMGRRWNDETLVTAQFVAPSHFAAPAYFVAKATTSTHFVAHEWPFRIINDERV